jgi:hypothetical protein
MIAERVGWGHATRTLAVFVFGAFLRSSGVSTTSNPLEPVPPQGHATPPSFAGTLEDGDIVFRRGRDLVSRIVLEADTASPYSHVGMVVKTRKGVTVVHAVPAEAPGELDEVKSEPLDAFLAVERSTSFVVYRVSEAAVPNYRDVRATAANLALALASRHIPFDSDLDLSTKDRLYCTELIHYVYQSAGLDLLQGKFDELNVPFKKGPFILPSSLAGSSFLRRVTSAP